MTTSFTRYCKMLAEAKGDRWEIASRLQLSSSEFEKATSAYIEQLRPETVIGRKGEAP
jgi:hypothetical protein